MKGEELLAFIWSGTIEHCDAERRSALASLLDGVLAVPTVCFEAKVGLHGPLVFADSSEIMPGIQLGDILAEELNVEVPINSVILIEPYIEADQTEVSVISLGRNLGYALETLATQSDRHVPRQAQCQAADPVSEKTVYQMNANAGSI